MDCFTSVLHPSKFPPHLALFFSPQHLKLTQVFPVLRGGSWCQNREMTCPGLGEGVAEPAQTTAGLFVCISFHHTER